MLFLLINTLYLLIRTLIVLYYFLKFISKKDNSELYEQILLIAYELIMMVMVI